MLRISVDDFFDREAEVAKLYALATGESATNPATRLSSDKRSQRRRRTGNALLLGAPRVGKTEILRKTFDRLFLEAGETAPFYFAFRRYNLEPGKFARHYLTQFLAQFLAFRCHDEKLLSLANESLLVISQKAHADDYGWVNHLVESFTQAEQVGETLFALRLALAAPLTAVQHTNLVPFLMLDNFHFIAAAGADLRQEIFQALAVEEHFHVPNAIRAYLPSYVLCGLRRSIAELLPADEGLFEQLDIIAVEAMAVEQLESMIRAMALRHRVEVSDSTIELMIQQLNCDLFYTRSLIDAAVAKQTRLKSFMDFERIYTEEVLRGRIRHYFDAVLRDIAPSVRERRAALELLSMVISAEKPLPLNVAISRLTAYTTEAEKLLTRLHDREFITINFNYVRATTDLVLADYIRAKYRNEIAGIRRPVAGEELLGEKLKHSYSLMMSRYHRSIELQLIELLARFDFQGVPLSLFNQEVYENRYQGLSRMQVRQSLDEEAERVRLPQIVLVNDIAASEYAGTGYRLFTAGGFDGGIYSEASEALWLVALINSREPLEVETVRQIEQRLELATRNVFIGKTENAIRWYISKEGFAKDAVEELTRLQAYRSTYGQLDVLFDYVMKLAVRDAKARPASKIELVIPIDDEAELIAARTVEQIARAANFDKEAINQIKTALIEACINAAEHGQSPDRKIYLRFALEDDRLIITVSNKGRAFLDAGGATAEADFSSSLKGTRGRGLKIIRGLMDEVRFTPTDDGTTLVMAKLLKPAKKQ